MDKQGKVSVGIAYEAKCDRIQELVGGRNHNDALRILIDSVVEDADVNGVKTVPRRNLGIKSKVGATPMP